MVFLCSTAEGQQPPPQSSINFIESDVSTEKGTIKAGGSYTLSNGATVREIRFYYHPNTPPRTAKSMKAAHQGGRWSAVAGDLPAGEYTIWAFMWVDGEPEPTIYTTGVRTVAVP